MARTQPLAGRFAIVTGASTGIGEAAARVLARRGASVAVVGRSSMERAQAVASDLRDLGGPASFAAQADVSIPEAVDGMVGEALERFGRIDILVNNAGGLGGLPRRSFQEMPWEEWEQVIALNLSTTYLCTAAVLPAMRAQKSGRIVNTSSEVARNPIMPIAAHYTAAKTGVSSFTRQLSREYHADGIRAFAFAPTTTLSEGLKSRYDDETLAGWKQSIPLGRFAETEDQGNVVAFLASGDADLLSGQTLDVTGGKITVAST